MAEHDPWAAVAPTDAVALHIDVPAKFLKVKDYVRVYLRSYGYPPLYEGVLIRYGTHALGVLFAPGYVVVSGHLPNYVTRVDVLSRGGADLIYPTGDDFFEEI